MYPDIYRIRLYGGSYSSNVHVLTKVITSMKIVMTFSQELRQTHLNDLTILMIPNHLKYMECYILQRLEWAV